MNKLTGYNNSQWLNLPIIMRKILALVIRLLNSTANTTYEPLTKKCQFSLSVKIGKQTSDQALKADDCL